MTELVAERFSEIVPRPVRWLWKSFLPRGKLCLLDGDPGVGKSLIAMDLAVPDLSDPIPRAGLQGLRGTGLRLGERR